MVYMFILTNKQHNVDILIRLLIEAYCTQLIRINSGGTGQIYIRYSLIMAAVNAHI